ncbi:hypothetical protein TNCV_1584051 [Trichonephila clavipes]|nr:hypothetical protein TNCV_1584051 [Trichonephila clavipes]
MLVRLPRAPVLSGGLRRKTQLFLRYPLHGRFLQDPTSPVQRSSEVQNPAPSASVPREQSVVSSFQKVKNHQTQLHSTQSGLPQDFVAEKIKIKKGKLGQCPLSKVGLWSRREKKKREIGMARKRAENRERSLGFPGGREARVYQRQ